METPADDRSSLAVESMTPIHWLGIVLAVVSAIVHLILGIGFLPHWMGAAFLFATVGFLFGCVLVVIGYRRRLVYLLGLPCTGGQIVLWYAVNEPVTIGALSTAELLDKTAQGLLIVVLLVLLVRE